MDELSSLLSSFMHDLSKQPHVIAETRRYLTCKKCTDSLYDCIENKLNNFLTFYSKCKVHLTKLIYDRTKRITPMQTDLNIVERNIILFNQMFNSKIV